VRAALASLYFQQLKQEKKEDPMGRYLVERSFPEGLKLSVNDEGASLCRMIALNNAEDGVTWIHSYVSDDRKKTYCICDAPSPEAIRRASRRNNLPIDRITDVRILNPFFYH
jgi:Nickel responsive protein SCO4226-like